jgi:hypothetical protein
MNGPYFKFNPIMISQRGIMANYLIENELNSAMLAPWSQNDEDVV